MKMFHISDKNTRYDHNRMTPSSSSASPFLKGDTLLKKVVPEMDAFAKRKKKSAGVL